MVCLLIRYTNNTRWSIIADDDFVKYLLLVFSVVYNIKIIKHMKYKIIFHAEFV